MIKGEKIDLTEIRSADAQPLFEWINDPATMRFNSAYTPVHELQHAAWFQDVTQDKSRVVFALRKHNDDHIVGVLQLVSIHPIHRSAELVIRIGEECDRGQGAGSEAIGLGIQFAFQHLNLQRVWLRVFAGNERAIQAYRKCGMQIEGTLRKSCFIDGHWIDEQIMAVLREDVMNASADFIREAL